MILHCLIPYESTKNPYKFCREGNPEESTHKIPLNFRVDSRFTYNQNFRVDILHHVAQT